MRKQSDIKIAKRLLRFVAPFTPIIAFSVIMGILGNLAAISVMAGSALLIAEVSNFSTGYSINGLIWFVALAAILRGLLMYAEQYSGHDVAFKLLAMIRDKAYQALRKLAPAKLTDKRSGDIVSTIMGDVEYIEVFFAHTIAPVIIGFIVPICVLCFVGSYWIGFAAILFVFQIGVGFLIPQLLKSEACGLGMQYREKLATTNSFLIDTLLGLKEIIFFGCSKERMKSMKIHGNDLTNYSSKLQRHHGTVLAMSEMFILSSLITMLFFAFQRYNSGFLNAGELLTIITVTASSFGPLMALSSLSNTLANTFAAAERIFHLMDEKPAVEENFNEIIKNIEEPQIIQFDNVSFNYPENAAEVLRNVNFSAPKGAKIALVGESGSGKSTILRLLLRYWNINTGEISFDKCNITEEEPQNIRSLISIVSQETYLFNESIAENIKIGRPDASDEEMIIAAKRANIHDFIMTMPEQYMTIAGEKGGKLSAGERQRIAIARALLCNRPILLLDEPTSNLDSLNEFALLKTLNSEFADKTIITVSHRPSTIAGFDTILRLKNGNLSVG